MQKGIVAVLIANLVNVAFSLATNFLLPKYLSIESYAGIKEFQLYVSYVGLFHLGFVDGIYLKYGGKTLGKDVDKEFSTDLSTMCIFQTVTTIAVLIVAIILRDRILAFFAISILPQNMSNYFKFLYQATGEFNLYGKAMNLTTISTFALNMVLLFVFRTDSVFWYIAGYVVLYFLIWIVLDVYFRKNHTLQKGALFSFKSFHSNIKAGFLLTLGNLSSIFLTSMDRWFVKALMDTLAFAQYSFAVSVENFLNLAITPVTTTLYNYFCRVNDEEEHRKVFNYVAVFATIIPAAAFPVKFILEVFLAKYIDSAVVVFLLFSAQIFYTVIRSIYVNLYKVQRKQKVYFVKLVIILAIGFALNCGCYAIVHVKEAVKCYVGEKLDNSLYTVDLICHGSPSPKVLDMFLAQYDIDTPKLSDIQFRNKNNFAVREGTSYIVQKGVLDKYSISFLNSISYTENCYHCQYANIMRVSDITLGDSWGSNLDIQEQRKGISLILNQTQKGKELLEQSELELMDVELNRAIEHNHQLRHPSIKPNTREIFFGEIKNGKNFNAIVRKLYPKQSAKQLVKMLLIKAKIMGGV